MENTWELLWIFVPDYNLKGQMQEIKNIPRAGNSFSIDDPDPFWRQTDACSGFNVGPDCPWRFEEMTLVTFTP